MGGSVGISPQGSGKIGSGAFNPASFSNWQRFLATDIDISPREQMQPLPPEVGSDLTPRDMYKTIVFAAGQVDFMPRADGMFGLLAYALMGQVSSVTGKDMDGNTVAGVNTHLFSFNQGERLPWFSMRKYVPGANPLAEYAGDCIMQNLRIVVPATGKMQMTASFLGRLPLEDPTVPNPDNLAWANTYNPSGTIPESCSATISLGADAPKVLSCTMNISNGTTQAAQEAIVGSYYLDDIIALQRSVSIQVVVKWESPDLYLKAFGGASNATSWTPNPYKTSGVGPNWGFKLIGKAPSVIASGRNYAFGLRAQDVVWSADGGPQLQAGNIVTQRFNGLVITPASGVYAQLLLQNATAAYAWA
jgi:hypothetical protein